MYVHVHFEEIFSILVDPTMSRTYNFQYVSKCHLLINYIM